MGKNYQRGLSSAFIYIYKGIRAHMQRVYLESDPRKQK